MKNEKIYLNADGHAFKPDPMREIPLAAQVIVGLANEGAERANLNDTADSGDLSVDQKMLMIRQAAKRIIAEMDVLKTKNL